MQPWPAPEFAGRLDKLLFRSELLRDNPLRDPADHPLWIYTPPGYDTESDRRYPSIYVIQGYTGQLQMWDNHAPYTQTFPQLADKVFASGEAPPAIVVYVDAWTAYGGSQFVDSPGTGKYHSYLCDEVVPYVDANFRTLDTPENRGITGKSSGGFGAMITPMLRPDLFGGLATHAGDSLYELSYVPEFVQSARHLRDYDGDIFKWWAEFQTRPAQTKPADMPLLATLGCSAAFSASDDGKPLLPFKPHSGELIPELWQRWLDWDPVRMAPKYADALRGLTAIWIDAGKSDEFHLDLGAEAFREAVLAAGVSEDVIHFELFEGKHGGINYRYPLSLAWLATRLTP